MKKNGVTKRTWDKNVRRFALERTTAWRGLEAFAKSHCRKKDEMDRMAFLEELCPLVDKYVDINCRIRDWCHKNGAPIDKFIEDVDNL